jgi:hypothetical protein
MTPPTLSAAARAPERPERRRAFSAPARWPAHLAGLALAALLIGCGAGETPAGDAPDGPDPTASGRESDAAPAELADAPPPPPEGALRVALFNIWELSTEKVDSVDAEGRGASRQLRAAARIIQAVRPHVLLLNEVDLARDGYGLDQDDLDRVVERFQERYLDVGDEPVRYPWRFAAPSNTGILTGLDLNRDGVAATPADVGTRTHGDDAFGYGEYPGQYSMAVLSRVALDTAGVRTFREFLWADLPDALLPTGFYGPGIAARFRLSSKSHWDLPVVVDGDTLHLLASHPTPPVFDGEENRNGLRNFDEIRFWALYLEGSDALYDDAGRRGGLPPEEPFVLAGDLNAAPQGGEAAVDGVPAIAQLLEHPRVRDPEVLRGVATTGWDGGRRIDYVLPSRGLEVVGGGVFAPPAGGPDPDPADLTLAELASDHHMVWLDLRMPADAGR